jgi:hypothetical protein
MSMPAQPDTAAQANPDTPGSARLPTLGPATAAASASRSATGSTGSHGVSIPSAPPGRMDRDFILQHQIVERYLVGRLPIKGAQDFEHFCKQHPELLDELGLGERVNSALRLLESGGRSAPWEQRAQRWWEQLPVLLALCVLCAALAVATLWTTNKLSALTRRSQSLEQQVTTQPLDPALSTRRINVNPSRTAPSTHPLAVIGGAAAELADLYIDMSWTRYVSFNVTVDRIDQGRVAILHNVAKDSNGNLHLALNSSALGPGDYELTIEGLTWSGQPVAQAWATITIAH